jgi:hypothetical protein
MGIRENPEGQYFDRSGVRQDFRSAEEIVELVRDGRATVPNFHILGAK